MQSDIQNSDIVLLAGTGILIMILLALAMLIYSNRAQRRLLQQQMQTQALELGYQQELIQRNLLTQEEERQRIAGHLHDDISSKLGVLHLTFHRLTRATPPTEELNLMSTEISDLITHTLQRVRAISHELLPPTLEDFGLIEAIKELGEQIRKTGAVDLQFTYALERETIGPALTELHLFRIVQELCNNSLKYAQASLITIELFTKEGRNWLRYRDDGQGFDLNTIHRNGLGMKNLDNRAKMIDAQLHYTTALGAGFEALVSWQ